MHRRLWSFLALWCKWRQEDFSPICSTDLRPCVLLAGPLQREGGDLTSELKSESLLGDYSLLVGYAQKAVESPGSLMQMAGRRLLF